MVEDFNLCIVETSARYTIKVSFLLISLCCSSYLFLSGCAYAQNTRSCVHTCIFLVTFHPKF